MFLGYFLGFGESEQVYLIFFLGAARHLLVPRVEVLLCEGGLFCDRVLFIARGGCEQEWVWPKDALRVLNKMAAHEISVVLDHGCRGVVVFVQAKVAADGPFVLDGL
jgi:hypothetical protein